MTNLRLLLILLLISLSTGTYAAEPFQAEYTVFKGTTKVGRAVLSLTSNENAMRWQLETEPSGIFILFTNKKPYTESIMHRSGNDFRLASILIAPRREDEPQETAFFNWQQQQIEIQAEGQRKQHLLENAVYDYLSIHWLAAEITRNAGRKMEFDFYRKGKIIRSSLKLIAQSEVKIGGETKGVKCYMQTFQSSSSKYRYCYDLNNPLLPLKIENTKSGRDPTIILFKKLKSGQ